MWRGEERPQFSHSPCLSSLDFPAKFDSHTPPPSRSRRVASPLQPLPLPLPGSSTTTPSSPLSPPSKTLTLILNPLPRRSKSRRIGRRRRSIGQGRSRFAPIYPSIFGTVTLRAARRCGRLGSGSRSIRHSDRDCLTGNGPEFARRRWTRR